MGKSASPAKKRTRDLERTRQEILGAAFWLVFRNGFQGVSVDDIVRQTSLTKGAFYHQFPTKLDLGYALVEEVIQPMILDRWIRPLDRFENPVEGILAQIEENIGGADPKDLRLGCPLNNLVQEMAPVDAGFKKRLQAALQLWIRETAKQLERARQGGHLKPGVDPKEAAHFVVMAHEGLYGIIKGLDDPKAIPLLIRSLRAYFTP